MANPFATRFTKPGEIPFFSSPGVELDNIIARCQDSNWIGQIVGPHGVGKTVLADAVRQRQTRFANHKHVVFRKEKLFQVCPGGSFKFNAFRTSDESSQPFTDSEEYQRGQLLVIVDGWENLSRVNRFFLHRHFERSDNGLIITTHLPIRSLPVLAELEPSISVFSNIVRYLQREAIIELSGDEIEKAYGENGGNYREAFMQLYDVYKQHQREFVLRSHKPLNRKPSR